MPKFREVPDATRPVSVASHLLTTREAAERLAVSDRTIANLVSRGRLRPVRIGRAVRFSPAEVERFIAEGGGR
jgi:excisionase family DNA binding protein